ncbi:MAG: hypothetical protein BWX86_02870 [Verrucomicrobia bacterium ADurb.Bin122]|nr:MAG: hypothetical protein BWX86_02870 [Verrucomicrobia bacterium ADurb.Bin122]
MPRPRLRRAPTPPRSREGAARIRPPRPKIARSLGPPRRHDHVRRQTSRGHRVLPPLRRPQTRLRRRLALARLCTASHRAGRGGRRLPQPRARAPAEPPARPLFPRPGAPHPAPPHRGHRRFRRPPRPPSSTPRSAQLPAPVAQLLRRPQPGGAFRRTPRVRPRRRGQHPRRAPAPAAAPAQARRHSPARRISLARPAHPLGGVFSGAAARTPRPHALHGDPLPRPLHRRCDERAPA